MARGGGRGGVSVLSMCYGPDYDKGPAILFFRLDIVHLTFFLCPRKHINSYQQSVTICTN